MKLAEALSCRADIQKRIAQLQNRLANNARVQEGENPAEDPSALIDELYGLITQLETLIARINKTNSSTFDGNDTLTDLLARRDCLVIKTVAMRQFLDNASATTMRGMRSEIKIISTVPVAELQKQVDDLSKELRQLDVKIQSLNWTTDLV